MTIEPGIRRTGSGWQAYVRVRGEFRSKHFPPDTPLVELRRWRDRQAAKRTLDIDEDEGGTIGRDAQTYLALVGHLESFVDRQHAIGQWVKALGATLPRSDITSVVIRRTLEKWRSHGLAAGTLNHRRAALMHLFTVLDGRSVPNPVKDVPRYPVSVTPWSLPSLDDAVRAVSAASKDPLNKSRVRLTVLLWTGWPSAQLKRLRPSDVDLAGKRVALYGRRKGKGTPDVSLPLLEQAVTAIRAFGQADAWGRFSNSSLHKAMHKGCRRAGVRAFRVYDLRHVFGTLIASIVKDDRVVAELLQHTSVAMTRRYTMSSADARVLAGLAQVELALK
jgi:integrase